MREIIAGAAPDHGILGEELDDLRTGATYVWVLDPIDGTKAFAAGLPVFCTLIGLLRDGQPILGVIDQPVLGERWVGAAGRGTTLNGRPAKTRSGGDLSTASLHATSPEMFRDGDDMAGFERLKRAVRYWHYGGEAYTYGLLAAGQLEIVCEATMKIYDYLPLVAVVEGAGGVITDWRGAPLGLDSDGRVLAACSPQLHATALALLAG
jgi:inositol-phosphate phosphatase/L-galactose 1-phosphate phosphatase/histidinol-phosphatase